MFAANDSQSTDEKFQPGFSIDSMVHESCDVITLDDVGFLESFQ
jgi:hypothetical protein